MKKDESAVKWAFMENLEESCRILQMGDEMYCTCTDGRICVLAVAIFVGLELAPAVLVVRSAEVKRRVLYVKRCGMERTEPIKTKEASLNRLAFGSLFY